MLETRAREEIDFRVGFGAAGSAARGHPADAPKLIARSHCQPSHLT